MPSDTKIHLGENPLLARIDELREALPTPLSREALCKAAGVDRSQLRRLEARGAEASVNAKTLAALARALRVPIETLAEASPKRSSPASPARAETVAAPRSLVTPRFLENGVVIHRTEPTTDPDAFVICDGGIELVQRPVGLSQAPRAYALFAANETLSPMHRRGDLIFVNPDRPARNGDSVIVRVAAGVSGPHAFLKIFERQEGDWYVCRQLNPAAEVRFKAAHVSGLHKVLGPNELFGV